jgi:hypothetical protein
LFLDAIFNKYPYRVDSNMEKRTYQDLMRIYQEMYQIDERAIGRAGTYSGDAVVGRVQGKSERGGWTGTPQTGLGRNFKGDKDKIKKRADDQYKKDRKSAAMDRRREGSAKPTKLDNLLKDIKGN